jgi:hypothetical protein
MSPAEPLEEQILAACVERLAHPTPASAAWTWYTPRFVDRLYKPLDAVNEFPGYIVLRAPEESGAELQTIDYAGSTVIASMGVEVLAYANGSEAEPTDRVLIRLLAQAEMALCAAGLLGETTREEQIDVQNTRRVLDHETEIGAPWRSLMSHLYRIRYLYTRGAP